MEEDKQPEREQSHDSIENPFYYMLPSIQPTRNMPLTKDEDEIIHFKKIFAEFPKISPQNC